MSVDVGVGEFPPPNEVSDRGPEAGSTLHQSGRLLLGGGERQPIL